MMAEDSLEKPQTKPKKGPPRVKPKTGPPPSNNNSIETGTIIDTTGKEEIQRCENCGGQVNESHTSCPHCGAEFEG